MELLKNDIKPLDIINEESFKNALAVDMALGCSTNSVLHLLAIANEAGIELDLKIINEVSDRTPNLCHLAPAGHNYIEDLYKAGGIPAVMKELDKGGFINNSLVTVTGKTIAENIKDAVNKNNNVLRNIENPYSKTGGIAILWGNIAKDGCVVKRSAVADEMLVHKGPEEYLNAKKML